MIKDTLTYDIVGSFLRPAEIKEARKAYKDGKITKEELTQAEDLAIASLVEKEVAHGLKYVTDGEFRRRWWHLDWLKEFDGFDTQPHPPPHQPPPPPQPQPPQTPNHNTQPT